MLRIIDNIFWHFSNILIWGGSDSYRWKMKSVGWNSWATRKAEEPKPEVGYEKGE